jgi:hypothetical protein
MQQNKIPAKALNLIFVRTILPEPYYALCMLFGWQQETLKITFLPKPEVSVTKRKRSF